MTRLGVLSLIAMGSTLFAACDQAPDRALDSSRNEPVVVYAALFERLFTRMTQAANAQASLAYPVNMKAAHAATLNATGRANVSSKNVGLVAWHIVDATKLAERACYR